jgi:hypothetical protein
MHISIISPLQLLSYSPHFSKLGVIPSPLGWIGGQKSEDSLPNLASLDIIIMRSWWGAAVVSRSNSA